MRLSVIPIVRAGGFGALPQLLEERAGEKTMLDVFERESLPIALRDAPTTPIPLLSMMKLFTRSGRQLGQRTLGLDVGAQMTHRAYGLWVEYCTQAPTLGEALQRVVTHCWAHVSGGVMELAAERDRRVLRFVVPDLGVPHIQHSDHLVPPMIMMMRHYLGKDWLPDWVEINYPRDPDAALMEDWLQVPVHFGGRGSGIAFGADVLSRSRDRRVPLGCRVLTLRDVAADIALKDAPEPARALSAAIALRLLDGRCDIDGAAQLVGLSVQGLQRRLRNKGVQLPRDPRFGAPRAGSGAAGGNRSAGAGDRPGSWLRGPQQLHAGVQPLDWHVPLGLPAYAGCPLARRPTPGGLRPGSQHLRPAQARACLMRCSSQSMNTFSRADRCWRCG